MAKETVETAATAVERFINNFGSGEDAELFVDKMCGMHRTLQQKFTSEVVMQFIRKMAKRYTDQWYDARNEAACRMCRLMWDAVKAEYGREGDEDNVSLPLI